MKKIDFYSSFLFPFKIVVKKEISATFLILIIIKSQNQTLEPLFYFYIHRFLISDPPTKRMKE